MLVVMTQSGQPSWEALAGVTNELEAHKKEKNSSEIPLKPQDTNWQFQSHAQLFDL